LSSRALREAIRLPRLVALVALSLVAFVATARADDPVMSLAQHHHERGEKLFALGKFQEALEQYQKAFDAQPVPAFLFNIGQCYRNLGDYESAIFSYKKYLELALDAPNRARVEKLVDELEAKQQQADSNRLRLDTQRKPPPLPPHHETPIYGKWWFWTGFAVVGAAGGIGIYEVTKHNSPPPTTLGTIVFGK
jgi:tetratricopeptide (TPR) repeat protein